MKTLRCEAKYTLHAVEDAQGRVKSTVQAALEDAQVRSLVHAAVEYAQVADKVVQAALEDIQVEGNKKQGNNEQVQQENSHYSGESNVNLRVLFFFLGI